MHSKSCRVRNNPGPRSEPYLRSPHHRPADRRQTDWLDILYAKLSEINTRFIERYYQSLLKRRAVINPLNKTSRNEFVSVCHQYFFYDYYFYHLPITMFFYYISVLPSKQYISWIIHTFYAKVGKNHLVIYTKTAS